jgi:nitroimidazol reductase NimA-like FMN-containing flavoprotein (pyridoxamine 5'-phosphate oxidase superfamily)
VEDGIEEMEKILENAEVGRISLCDDSTPYIVPVNFFYHKRKIVFHCAWEGKKLDIIAKNSYCCFEVDEYTGEATPHQKIQCHLDYDSVLAYGKARIEDNEEEKIRLLQMFAEKYSENYRKPVSEGGKRFDKTRVFECCCIVIDVEELTGRRERTGEKTPQKTIWHHRF